MTTALALAQQVANASPRANMAGWCQQFAGLFWEAAKGRPTPNSYASADAARKASTIVSTDAATAPPGAFHWFKENHVGVALGSGLMADASARTSIATANLGHGILVHHVTDYPLTYLGWSYTNGNRERIEGLTDANAPQLAGNQRRVKTNANLRVRLDRDPASARIADLAPGEIFTPTGYRRGARVSGIDLWYAVRGGWAWAGGTTDPTTHDLTDLSPTPVPDPEPEQPADPTEEEPMPEPQPQPAPQPTRVVPLDDERLAALLATAQAAEPAAPVIPDRPAKVLWIVLSLVGVSAGPVVALTVLDWAHWDAQIGTQFATTVAAWVGTVGVVLGLSRYAKTRP